VLLERGLRDCEQVAVQQGDRRKRPITQFDELREPEVLAWVYGVQVVALCEVDFVVDERFNQRLHDLLS
jgi:hypothetical protein